MVAIALAACASELPTAGDGSAGVLSDEPLRPQYVVISPQWPDELLEPGVLDDMIAKLGRGRPSRRLGWMLRIQGFQEIDSSALEAKLAAAFALAESKDLPLALHLDFEFWWENRPDLWNWFDPAMAGYDPTNRDNVEWNGWDSPISERTLDWGTPVTIRPPPCFNSPRVRDEVRTRAGTIAAATASWLAHLRDIGRTDLLIGINPTGETSIPDGLGYCALHFRGFSAASPPADPLHELQAAARNYAAFENRVFHNAGFPTELLSTHAPSWTALWTAITDEATPGFSLYPGFAIGDVLAVVGDGAWVVAEAPWQTLGELVDQPHMRWIALYNWAHGYPPGTPGLGDFPIAENQPALAVIAQALDAVTPQAVVWEAYTVVLARPPESLAALDAWVATLASSSKLAVLTDLFASPEFQARNAIDAKTDRQFVAFLYNLLLGRAPDPAGLDAWAAQLASGGLTRAAVFRGFVESVEFQTIHPVLAD